MANNIREEYDPLETAEDDSGNSIDINLDNDVEQEQAEVVDEPVVMVKPTVSIKYYPTYQAVPDGKTYDLDVAQRLPNVLVTQDDLDEVYTLCKEQIKEHKGDIDKKVALDDIISSFYQISYNTYGEDYQSFFDKNVDALAQYAIGSKAAYIRINHPQLQINDSTDTLTGKAAMRYLGKATKTGIPTRIPLWHSGLILTIDPFLEQEMVDLNIELGRNQINMGMETRGASFSGDDIHVVGTITDAILEHVIDCSLKGYDRTNLSKLILVHDIPMLFAGALQAIYPSGYPVFHSCTNKTPNACDYNLTAKRKPSGDFYPDSLLDFSKTAWVNTNALTQEQTAHMSALSREHKYEDVTKYQQMLKERHNEKANACVWSNIDGGVRTEILVGFKIPNLIQYAKTSNEWIRNVKAMAEKTVAADTNLSSSDKVDKKNKVLNSYAAITDMVKHLGWIDYVTIVIGDSHKNIVDESTIRETLENFIKIDGVKESLEKAIQEFKESTVIAWTGIQNFECPVCKHGQVDPSSKTPSLIPINMVGYFFSTLVWRKRTRQQMD